MFENLGRSVSVVHILQHVLVTMCTCAMAGRTRKDVVNVAM